MENPEGQPSVVARVYDVIAKIAATDAAEVATLIHKIGDDLVSFRVEGERYEFALNLNAIVDQLMAEAQERREVSRAA